MTLVEVMMGLSILSVVMVGIYQLFGQGYQTMESARDLNRITQTLQYQMENLRSTKWDDFTKLEGTTEIGVNAYGIPVEDGNETNPFDWQAFKMVQTITMDKPGFYKMTLVVNWTDRRGRKRSHTFNTWFSQDGLNTYYTRST